MKACAGKPTDWAQKAPHIFRAERITPRKHLGASLCKMACGVDPILPFDFTEATWLMDPFSAPMTNEQLISTRARMLEKREDDIILMRERVKKFRQDLAERMLRTFKGIKAPQCVKPGTLVLVKNKRIETEHNRKPKPRWLGPFIVIRQHGGSFQSSYIVSELNRVVLTDRVAAARIRIYWPRVDMSYEISRIIQETPEHIWERATGPQRVDEEAIEDEDEDATAGLPEPESEEGEEDD